MKIQIQNKQNIIYDKEGNKLNMKYCKDINTETSIPIDFSNINLSEEKIYLLQNNINIFNKDSTFLANYKINGGRLIGGKIKHPSDLMWVEKVLGYIQIMNMNVIFLIFQNYKTTPLLL